MATHTFIAGKEQAGQRLDRWVADQLPGLTRTRVQELIAEGRVRVNGAASKASHRLAPGEAVEVEALPRPPLRAQAEEIPLDVLYEDEDVVVVNKPAAMVVHAGAGKSAQHGTLVNALLGRYRNLSMGSDPGGLRPGIVHRLDKETSGCIVVARNDAAHAALGEQFQQRRIQKTYLALVLGALVGASGKIELPITRDAVRRTRMTAKTGRGRASRTDWRTLLVLRNQGQSFTLVQVGLHSGRTHQIRVHFSALGHPVAGDELYGAARRPRAGRELPPPLGRNFLHAARILFYHPRTGRPLEVRAPLPVELKDYLERIGRACGIAPEKIDAALRGYL